VTNVLVTLLVGIAAVWGAFALWYQASRERTVRLLCLLAWSAFSSGCLAGVWLGFFEAASLAFTAMFVGVLIWWRSLSASNQRRWADDVAQMTQGTVDGDRVTLTNVRDFIWRTESDYTQRWETRHYDLSQLHSLDMIISYWAGPAIAHMLISFGFDGGDHVVFSTEIRREKDEVFSEVGGFFKEFELVIIAADERDIVRLRTNVRREQTYLYRLRINPPAIRSLFLAYLEEANDLARRPRFYHTISGNCTTIVYRMLKRILGRLPFSYRVLLSGYLPEYVHKVGGLDPRFPLAELRAMGYISERARNADQSATFSADIRQGVPSLPTY